MHIQILYYSSRCELQGFDSRTTRARVHMVLYDNGLWALYDYDYHDYHDAAPQPRSPHPHRRYYRLQAPTSDKCAHSEHTQHRGTRHRHPPASAQTLYGSRLARSAHAHTKYMVRTVHGMMTYDT
jgi:hypothetical protein